MIHYSIRDAFSYEQVFWHRAITGWPTGALASLRKKTGALGRSGRAYHAKIGITDNPERRWVQAYRPAGWQRMHVIYRSSSHKLVRQVETLLIDHALSVSQSAAWYYNSRGGGGGRTPSGLGPYYVYVVTAPRWARIT
jgi:hypothetical protein